MLLNPLRRPTQTTEGKEVNAPQQGVRVVQTILNKGTHHAIRRPCPQQPGTAGPAQHQTGGCTNSALGGSRGAGLGLTLVDLITRRHHGLVELDSRPGEGTRVALTLPGV